MPAYFIAHITVTDPAEYSKYLDACDAVLAQYGGRYLAVDDAPVQVEGDVMYDRTVLIGFDSAAQASAWYHSDAYQSILRYRLGASRSTAQIIPGCR